MKKLLLSFLAGTIMLTGCLETTQEVTLTENGSGTLSTTSDMGMLLGLAKQMGGGAELENDGDKAMDTTIYFGAAASSMPDLSIGEKELLEKGSMNMKLNMKNEEFKTRLSFPFNNGDELVRFNKLSGKLLSIALKDQMGEGAMGGMGGQMPALSSFDDYFVLEISNGELKKKLNKEKYAAVASDEFLNGLKEAAGMGIPVGATYIFNLPRPADKVEGTNVQLSDDKKKVTVKVELDDFFEHPEKFEFKIKY